MYLRHGLFAVMVATAIAADACAKSGGKTCRKVDSPTETVCVKDFDTNNDYCGSCKTRCTSTQQCSAGKCVSTATCRRPSETLCKNKCKKLKLDAHNCGSCGNECASTSGCYAGYCTPACQPGLRTVNGECYEVLCNISPIVGGDRKEHASGFEECLQECATREARGLGKCGAVTISYYAGSTEGICYFLESAQDTQAHRGGYLAVSSDKCAPPDPPPRCVSGQKTVNGVCYNIKCTTTLATTADGYFLGPGANIAECIDQCNEQGINCVALEWAQNEKNCYYWDESFWPNGQFEKGTTSDLDSAILCNRPPPPTRPVCQNGYYQLGDPPVYIDLYCEKTLAYADTAYATAPGTDVKDCAQQCVEGSRGRCRSVLFSVNDLQCNFYEMGETGDPFWGADNLSRDDDFDVAAINVS